MRLLSALLVVGFSLGGAACSASDTQSATAEDAATSGLDDAGAETSTPAEDAAQADVTGDDASGAPAAVIETTFGTIRIELNPDASPITVENFRKYADASFYDGLLFHRVIPDFMIQGGGLEPGMVERDALFDPIVNEAATSGLSNLRGTIAMARTSAPNSATSQFFINTADNTFLDAGQSDPAGYAVFGTVTEGMDVVDQISAVETHSVGIYDDVPVQDVVMTSVRVQ